MHQQEITLFVACNAWFRKNSSVCFEETQETEFEYFMTLEEAKAYADSINKEAEDNCFVYEAVYKFPVLEKLIQYLISERMGNNSAISDLFWQYVKIINRIDPDEL